LSEEHPTHCWKLSISVPSIAHTEENKTSRSYAKIPIYVGMILDKTWKNTLLNFLTQILYQLCYIFHVRWKMSVKEDNAMEFINKYPTQFRIATQAFLIVLAIVFICVGASRGEVESVFSKAIRLCLECVGIG